MLFLHVCHFDLLFSLIFVSFSLLFLLIFLVIFIFLISLGFFCSVSTFFVFSSFYFLDFIVLFCLFLFCCSCFLAGSVDVIRLCPSFVMSSFQGCHLSVPALDAPSVRRGPPQHEREDYSQRKNNNTLKRFTSPCVNENLAIFRRAPQTKQKVPRRAGNENNTKKWEAELCAGAGDLRQLHVSPFAHDFIRATAALRPADAVGTQIGWALSKCDLTWMSSALCRKPFSR